ncbi:MAG: hypothetical protein HQL47_03675 [Gammaproteobacteria bacterium]|nr:hypothetical protein [Gammaproteobacteria bacterium]
MADFWKGFSGGFNAMQGAVNARSLKEEREADRLYREQAFAEQQRQFELSNARQQAEAERQAELYPHELGLKKSQAENESLVLQENKRKGQSGDDLRSVIEVGRQLLYGPTSASIPTDETKGLPQGQQKYATYDHYNFDKSGGRDSFADFIDYYTKNKARVGAHPEAAAEFEQLRDLATRKYVQDNGMSLDTDEGRRLFRQANIALEPMDKQRLTDMMAIDDVLKKGNLGEAVERFKRGDLDGANELFTKSPLYGADTQLVNLREVETLDPITKKPQKTYAAQLVNSKGEVIDPEVTALEIEHQLLTHKERMELASKIVTADKDRKATESSDIKTLVDMQKSLNERLLMEPDNEELRKQSDTVNQRLDEFMRQSTKTSGGLGGGEVAPSLDQLLAKAKAGGATTAQLDQIRARYQEKYGQGGAAEDPAKPTAKPTSGKAPPPEMETVGGLVNYVRDNGINALKTAADPVGIWRGAGGLLGKAYDGTVDLTARHIMPGIFGTPAAEARMIEEERQRLLERQLPNYVRPSTR